MQNSVGTGNQNYSLVARDDDADTYKKFTIVQINSTHAKLGMNYTFDFEVSRVM